MLTKTQRIALHVFADNNIGCILVAGYGFVWPVTIRTSEEAAYQTLRVLAGLGAKQGPIDSLSGLKSRVNF